MFAVISLVLDYARNEKIVSLVVKENRIFDLNECRIRNNGVNRNQNYRIFYSPNEFSVTNFDIPLRNHFDPAEDACYIARIILFYGKSFFCCFISFVV